jgi:hypothetical protein
MIAVRRSLSAHPADRAGGVSASFRAGACPIRTPEAMLLVLRVLFLQFLRRHRRIYFFQHGLSCVPEKLGHFGSDGRHDLVSVLQVQKIVANIADGAFRRSAFLAGCFGAAWRKAARLAIT